MSTESSTPMTNHIMQYFTYGHLPEDLQEVSKMFCDLAVDVDKLLEESPEKSVTLRKLLEAKDCAVRARDTDIKNQVRDERIQEVKSVLRVHTPTPHHP